MMERSMIMPLGSSTGSLMRVSIRGSEGRRGRGGGGEWGERWGQVGGLEIRVLAIRRCVCNDGAEGWGSVVALECAWRLQREWVLSVRDGSVRETTYCRWWRDCFLHHASTMAHPLAHL